ncbi:hypothetical protein AgCh_013737 [Apium graveolens]
MFVSAYKIGNELKWNLYKFSEKPKTPAFVEDDDFVDKNEEFINLDDDLDDVEDENDENNLENELENDNDNVEGGDEDDNVEDANMLYGKIVVAESSKNKWRREVLPKNECKVRMNVLRDERKKRFEISDAQAGLDLFHRLNEESGSKYFIRTKFNEENRLKCLV